MSDAIDMVRPQVIAERASLTNKTLDFARNVGSNALGRHTVDECLAKAAAAIEFLGEV